MLFATIFACGNSKRFCSSEICNIVETNIFLKELEYLRIKMVVKKLPGSTNHSRNELCLVATLYIHLLLSIVHYFLQIEIPFEVVL